MQRFDEHTCQPVMKALIFATCILLICSCVKPADPTLNVVDLGFSKTNTVSITTVAQGINSDVTCVGADLCYTFSHFEIRQSAAMVYDIYAKGTHPGKEAICAQAIYTKDTTVRISTSLPGQYLFRFYNRIELFDTDTVQVN